MWVAHEWGVCLVKMKKNNFTKIKEGKWEEIERERDKSQLEVEWEEKKKKKEKNKRKKHQKTK